MSRRQMPIAPALLVILAGLAWWQTVVRMSAMGAAPGTDLGALGWFMATWVMMMTAMMFPAVAATCRLRGRGPAWWRRAVGVSLAVVAYVTVWAIAGLFLYLALQVGRSSLGHALQWRHGGQGLCVAVLVLAAGYQLTDLKADWLVRCHVPVIDTGAGAVDALASGLRAGVRCVASSWALVAALFALGGMSVVWMVVIAILIAAERLAPVGWWGRPGVRSLRAASAAILVALAVGLAIRPESVPGFTTPSDHAASRAMSDLKSTSILIVHSRSPTDGAFERRGALPG